MASSTITCRMRCIPPFRSRPRWMRFNTACLRPSPLNLSGLPKMPKTKTNSTTMMTTVLMSKVLCMVGASLLCFLGFVVANYGHDGRLGSFQAQIVGRHTQMHRVVLERDNAAANSALGGDTIPGFQLADHLLPPLLPPLLGQNQQKIKDGKDREHEQQPGPAARRTATLRQKSACCNFTH